MSQLILWFLLVFCTDPQSTSIWSNPILDAKTARIDRSKGQSRPWQLVLHRTYCIPWTPCPPSVSSHSLLWAFKFIKCMVLETTALEVPIKHGYY